MPSSHHEPITLPGLNRALLARQLLLEPATLDPVGALEQIGGAQAQEPASPYLALWTRLASFDPAALHAAFVGRQAVKANLMRITLHAVSARDYGALLPVLLPMLRGTERMTRRGVARPERIPEIAAAVAAFAGRPRRSTDIRDFVAKLTGEPPDTPTWWWIRRHLPLVNVPEDVPWSFTRRPILVTPEHWLGMAPPNGRPETARGAALEQVLRRYLGAFGPASTADVAAWSGLAARDFAPAIAALDATGELRRFSDPHGRTLLDLAAAPRPSEDTPAPPRLLPMWDSVLLAHRDRSRIMVDEDRPVVIGRNGDVLPTFLVDGRVAGLWWTEPAPAGTRVVLEPFGRLRAGDRRALQAAGERLAAFVERFEPRVYARYRTSRARR